MIVCAYGNFTFVTSIPTERESTLFARFLLLHPVNTMVFTFLLLLVHFTLVKVAYCNSDATAAAVKVAMIAVAVRTEKPVEVIVADSPQQIAP